VFYRLRPFEAARLVTGHWRELLRRCGVIAQRWRCKISAFSGHGPAMHSTQCLLLLLLLMAISF
jgi:hypothetical protein